MSGTIMCGQVIDNNDNQFILNNKTEIEKLQVSLQFNLQFFAEGDSDKTEEATPRRKTEARKKGQVAKSVELNSVVVLLGLFIILNSLGSWFYFQFVDYFKDTLSPAQLNRELTVNALKELSFQHLLFYGKIFLPLGLGAMLFGLIVNYAQVGVLFTLEPLKPQFGRINPFSGFKRILSPRSLVELVKASIKLIIVSYVAYSTIKARYSVLILSIRQSPFKAALDVWSILYQVTMKICVFLLILAVFDYAYQRWEYNKSLRMTKKEIKDEFKQMEGDPQVKAKIKQRQRQMAARRMMQEVPKADVVITNPTHFAVALKYDPLSMAAPVVIAKGEGYVAAKIKEIAKEHDIVTVENKPLAQTLFKTVDIGEEVPAKLFQAVAEVLAFVYRLRQQRASG